MQERNLAERKTADALHFEIRQRILSSQYKIGDRIPPERELARAFGCSPTTVGKALSRLAHDGLVERRTRAGTRVVKDQLEAKSPAISLDACAFVYPNEEHEGIWRIVQGFRQAAREARRRVVTLTTGTDFRKEAEIIGRLGEFDVKGAVVYPVLPEEEDRLYFAQMLSKCPFPVVLADVTLPGVSCPAVLIDGFHAAYTMTRYLVGRGLKRIGFLGNGAWTPSTQNRYRGYCWALEEAGLTEPPGGTLLEPSMRPNFKDPIAESRLLARRFLESAGDLEGVVCHDDFVAIGCLVAAQELGVRVPEQLKVVGIADWVISAQSAPPLTTYRVSCEELGRQAFQMLECLLHGETPERMEIQVRGEIVVRQSS